MQIKTVNEYEAYVKHVFRDVPDSKSAIMIMLCMQSFYDGLKFRDEKLVVDIEEKR